MSVLAQASSATAQTPVVTTVKITVGADGFEPKRISVPVGTVHFFITSSGGDHCFAIPTLDVEKRVRAARPLEADVSFEKAGEFPFLCCSEPAGSAENGVIVVSGGK